VLLAEAYRDEREISENSPGIRECTEFFYSLFHVFSFPIFYFNFFLGNAVLKLRTHFHLVHCIFAVVIVSHFLRSLMAFDCQEIKGLLTYLLTYLLSIKVVFNLFYVVSLGLCSVIVHPVYSPPGSVDIPEPTLI